jgi:hypothetical protein
MSSVEQNGHVEAGLVTGDQAPKPPNAMAETTANATAASAPPIVRGFRWQAISGHLQGVSKPTLLSNNPARTIRSAADITGNHVEPMLDLTSGQFWDCLCNERISEFEVQLASSATRPAKSTRDSTKACHARSNLCPRDAPTCR